MTLDQNISGKWKSFYQKVAPPVVGAATKQKIAQMVEQQVAKNEMVKKKYRLAGAAIDMEEFSIADLVDLTGVRPKTVETFIGDLRSRGLIEWDPQAPGGKGRPRNIYRLTSNGRSDLLADLRRERERKMAIEEKSPAVVSSLSDDPIEQGPYPLMIQTVHTGPTYVVYVAVPGLEKDDVMCKVEEQQLILSGVKQEPVESPHPSPFRMGKFEAGVDLPSEIANPQLMHQDVQNGIWTIEVTAAIVKY
jgi:HSP20 family molecular chaperone IbpA